MEGTPSIQHSCWCRTEVEAMAVVETAEVETAEAMVVDWAEIACSKVRWC